MKTVLAVDLGGTKTAMALIDETGHIARKEKVASAHTPEATLEQIAEFAPQPEAIGMTVPGIYDRHTGTAWAPNLWGWDYVPLRAAVENRFSVKASIASDRTGYVAGEQWLGAARGFSDIVFVAIGTGIGVGIISNGRVIEGAHGIAGAAGWMGVDRNRTHQYEHVGGWEAEAAGPAVARRAGMDSAESVVRAAQEGDVHAAAVLRETAEIIGIGVANLISILDPEIVVLGGGLMQASELLLPAIRATVPRWAQPLAAARVQIELTRLGEDAGLLGAAKLAFLEG